MKYAERLRKTFPAPGNEIYVNWLLGELDNITDIDSIILQYLIDETIYKFMKENYDGEYQLPVRHA